MPPPDDTYHPTDRRVVAALKSAGRVAMFACLWFAMIVPIVLVLQARG